MRDIGCEWDYAKVSVAQALLPVQACVPIAKYRTARSDCATAKISAADLFGTVLLVIGALPDETLRTEMRADAYLHFFSPAVQLTTTEMGCDADCSGAVLIRKRWPSADTSYS